MWRRTIDEVEVARIRLPVRGLPAALKGMVACQISDLHVDRDEDLERLELAVERDQRAEAGFGFSDRRLFFRAARRCAATWPDFATR